MCLRNACLILFGLVSSGLRAAPEVIPVLTVCEVLKDLDRYEGKSVIVVGRSSSTDEGSCLNEECGLKVVWGGREFDAQISTAVFASESAPPPQLSHAFRWDKRQVQRKLEQLRLTTDLRTLKDRKYRQYNDRWFAQFGRLETCPSRAIIVGDRRTVHTSGCGHLNASPAQLVSPADGYLRIK
jgi:hypothetical protein